MQPRKRRIIAAALALILLASAVYLWHPRSLSRFCRELDRAADAAGGIYLSHNTPDGKGAGLRCSVSEAEQFRQTVFELLRSAGPDGEQ